MDTAAVTQLFRESFNYTPTCRAGAPGRLEVLGNHTDYNEGLVMSAAVDRYITFAASPRNDGRIELVSSAFPGREVFPIDRLERNPAAPWADYIKGVLLQLRRRGVHFSGFSAAVHGTIPLGAGMSSSAALEVATALIVRELFPFTLVESGVGVPPVRDAHHRLPPIPAGEKMLFARLAQAAENEFVGVRCGLLDQISSLFGKAAHVMSIDFRSLTVQVAPLIGEAFVICNSGVKHELVAGEYNALRQNCESAARKLHAQSLRSVELSQLKATRASLTGREYECAHHVVSEIARVVAAERALRANDHAQFGQYMYQSHESSRHDLRNSGPELDLLVDLAREHPGCLGARLTGGGFGGATLNLVAHHQVQDFMAHMAQRYHEKTGNPLTPMVCRAVDGAG